jgi:hypothetical protein
LDIEELKRKKEILNFIRIYPKNIKAVLDFQNKLFFIIDGNEEEVEDLRTKIKELFDNSLSVKIEDYIEGLYDGNQYFIRITQDSDILFDTGIIKSFRNLIEKGKIKPSKEAIYHSFLKALKQKDAVIEHGKSMVANMFWSLYYLLQSYFMLKEKYVTPYEILELLKFLSKSNYIDQDVLETYSLLYNLYYYIHNYNLEDIETLLKKYEKVFNKIKEILERELQKDKRFLKN